MMNKKIPIKVDNPIYNRLKLIQPFDIDIIRLQICAQLEKKPKLIDELFEKRRIRCSETIKYALGVNLNNTRQEVIDRTVNSLNAEMGIAYILGGVDGVFAWLENDDISFDVPTPEFNLEIKTSFAFWPTMHTAGAYPYGKSKGLDLHAGMKGKADIYLVFMMVSFNGRIIYYPNYFFSKRAILEQPYTVCTAKKDGAYVNRANSTYAHFYTNWCTP